MTSTKFNLTSPYITRDRISPYSRIGIALADPDKILSENNYDYSILRDIMNDPHVVAASQQRKMQVMQMDYEIDFTGDKEILNEIILIMNNMETSKIISGFLDSIFYGFSVGEIYWKMINGKIVPIDILDRPQEYFFFDDKNQLRLRESSNGFFFFDKGTTLPDYKFILIQNKPTFDNPYGEKLLSRCYWSVIFKREVLRQWQLLTERYGVPFLVGKYPSAATEEEKEILLNQLSDMIDSNISVMKEGTLVDFIENPKNEVGGLFENLVNFHNREISKAILSVTLTTEMQKYGNYKSSEIHKELLEYIGISDKKLVEKAFNKLFEYYIHLNYGKIESPRIRFMRKENVIEESADRDVKLTQMGIKFSKEYFIKRYNLNEKDFSL
jgi:phage gp29-like protein